MIDLDAIEARCKAATEGPWVRDDDSAVRVWHPLPTTGFGRVADCVVADDAKFLTHARTDLPWLVALLRRCVPSLEFVQLLGGHADQYLRDEARAILRELGVGDESP